MTYSNLGLIAAAVLGLGVAVVACNAGGNSVFEGDSSNNSGGAGGENAGGNGTGAIGGGFNPNGSGGSSGTPCVNDPNVDDDMDGATEMQGDCNDCDPNTGPGAIEVQTDPDDPMAELADEN